MIGATDTVLIHERWFTEDWRFPVQWDAAFTPSTWVPLGVALSGTAAAVLLWRARGRWFPARSSSA